jgi:hypothetical protein
MSPDERPGRGEPVIDALGKLVQEGKDAATYLWQVPDDAATRSRLQQVLVAIRDQSAKQGRREMPAVCEELLTALRASPSPQQVDLLQAGFDRLYKMWAAARTGMM